MAQQLIQQKTEQLEHMRETYNYLLETHPAKASLGETIKEVEAAIENIKKEQAKTRPKAKAYSSRQEADKKVAGSRVAYIKERQKKRAVEHRLKTRKERAIANVARQEEAERRFNQPKYGKKDKVFPLAEGELAEERQAAPMHRRERAFIKDDDEEMPEIRQRKMEVPPSEKKRLQRKRQEEKKKKRVKKVLAKLKKKEKQEKEVAEKPKGPKEPDHPPPSQRQGAASSRDKWGRKVSIGSRRAGATGLATFSPRRSLRIQKKKKGKLRRSQDSAPKDCFWRPKAEEPRPETWSNGTRLISLRQW